MGDFTDAIKTWKDGLSEETKTAIEGIEGFDDHLVKVLQSEGDRRAEGLKATLTERLTGELTGTLTEKIKKELGAKEGPKPKPVVDDTKPLTAADIKALIAEATGETVTASMEKEKAQAAAKALGLPSEYVEANITTMADVDAIKLATAEALKAGNKGKRIKTEHEEDADAPLTPVETKARIAGGFKTDKEYRDAQKERAKRP